MIAGADPPGAIFTDDIFQEGFSAAYDEMYNAFLRYQCPRIEIVQDGILVPPLTFSLTPAQMNLPDFGDIIYLRERTAYSTEKFKDINQTDDLPQRDPTDRIINFTWRNNTFYFVGATGTRELEIKYDSSGEAPTSNSAQIAVDSSLNFLANYAVGVSGRLKGYEEIADACMVTAIGKRSDQGIIGGQLFALIQPLVRSRQNVQIARKPFSATRWRAGHIAVPYIAAQPPVSGGQTSMLFSSAAGTITGTIDGANNTFALVSGTPVFMMWFINGLLQTPGVDYATTGNTAVFVAGHLPQSGDTLSCLATF
jgi:hypothetical protein